MGIERIREEVFCNEVEGRLEAIASKMYQKGLDELSDARVYNCVLQLTKEWIAAGHQEWITEAHELTKKMEKEAGYVKYRKNF